MQKSNVKNISPATRYQNAAIQYYLELTNSPFLHYGYWESPPVANQELTISQLRIAQEAYSNKLLSFIPEGVNSILDVGCGIGGNASYLLERGFTVEGLAPDGLQEEMFLKQTNCKAPFHLTKFEDFKTTNSYNLILLSESSQYIAASDIAQCASRLLSSDGYLLLADMLRVDDKYNEGIFSNCHVVTELNTALGQAGFELVKTEDISSKITPTIDLCIDNFRTFGLSTGKYIGNVLNIAVPPLYGVFNWAFKRWLEKPIVEGLQAKYIFEKHLCYQIQLWRLVKT
ncbi:hypothetical protein DSM106972_045720 [Dulcicalothrix desertica PCC 7102]|uniref:SAM-dependent methyltransferase n=1 Tax=Dulcicalothrix desertica PCC 7102 TaxID=232991 RepID=A0A433VE18_9CYAN|nr:methyltransferase domain-containing protein [Dulcicalothrix desertica]RUT04344.1 hypothetical protein DSM106972_045720 [Dulcicalothrix desertica PCC 7102]TWH51199.1 MPBQ/MSBQ methyltransferase [Dulcicalothrix desertica PCC 7102]